MNSEQTSILRRSGRVKLFGWAGLCLLGGGFLIGAFQDEIDDKFDDILVPTDGFYRFALGGNSYSIPLRFVKLPRRIIDPAVKNIGIFMEIEGEQISLMHAASFPRMGTFDFLRSFRSDDTASKQGFFVTNFALSKGNLGAAFRNKASKYQIYEPEEYSFGTKIIVGFPRLKSSRMINKLQETELTFLFDCPGFPPMNLKTKVCLGAVSDLQLGISYKVYFDNTALPYVPSIFQQFRYSLKKFSLPTKNTDSE